MSEHGETLLDSLLEPWRKTLGADYLAYRNHCQRVFHLTRAHRRLVSDVEDRLIALACVYHDLGLWTHKTLDYLEPSCELAAQALRTEGAEGAIPVLRAMILEHHALRAVGPDRDLVEAFRRADWTDVSLGRRRFGLDPAIITELKTRYPNAGFHKRLLVLGAKWSLTNPLNPLPMLRW